MDIREEKAGDEAAVRELHRVAFGDEGDKVAGLVDGLRSEAMSPESLSLVAADGGEVVGHVLFTASLLDAPRELVAVQVLSPVSVLLERQGEGIGSVLIQAGLRLLDERLVPMVFLEGPPRFYSRLGFRAAAELGFRKPSLRIPDAAFQVVLLAAFQPWMTGTLVYSEVFWQHDAVGLREAVPSRTPRDGSPHEV